jgi:hypothetical protein
MHRQGYIRAEFLTSRTPETLSAVNHCQS